MTRDNSMLLAAGIYIVLSIVVLWALYRTARWIVVGICRAARSKGVLLGDNPRTKLLGLTISALLFTPLITRLAQAVVNLTANLFDRVPRELLSDWQSQSAMCDIAARKECFAGSWLVLLNATGTAVSSSIRDSGILQVQLGLIALALGLWVLSTALLNALTEPDATGKVRLNLRSLMAGREHRVTRQNFLFFLILFIGTYLSLASIAAVPDLRAERGTAPQDLTTKLNRSLLEHGVLVDPTLLSPPLRLVDSILHPGTVTGEPIPRTAASRASAGLGLGKREGSDASKPVAGAVQPAAAETEAAAQSRTGEPGTTNGQAGAPRAGSGQAAGPDASQGRDATASTTGASAGPRPGGGTLTGDTAAKDSAGAAQETAGTRADSTGLRLRASPAEAAFVRETFHSLNRLWTERAERHQATERRVLRRSRTNLNLAMASFAYSDSTWRLREQRSYTHVLRRWYLQGNEELQREYDQSTSSLGVLHRTLRAWSTAASSYLSSPTPDTTQLNFLRREAVRLQFNPPADPVPARIPPIPSRGEELGVFQWISGWLLRTDSLSLTLIVGMLGFGLLGAAASTFVREQSAREHEEEEARQELRKQGVDPGKLKAESESPMQPLVLNLPSVVIRGGSAAIVVFLGIMGGLSVFTSEADPNPYALLFTCLVGAVFSEKVWNWAEERFDLNQRSSRSDGKDQNGNGGNGGNGTNGGGDAGNGGAGAGGAGSGDASGARGAASTSGAGASGAGDGSAGADAGTGGTTTGGTATTNARTAPAEVLSAVPTSTAPPGNRTSGPPSSKEDGGAKD